MIPQLHEDKVDNQNIIKLFRITLWISYNASWAKNLTCKWIVNTVLSDYVNKICVVFSAIFWHSFLKKEIKILRYLITEEVFKSNS